MKTIQLSKKIIQFIIEGIALIILLPIVVLVCYHFITSPLVAGAQSTVAHYETEDGIEVAVVPRGGLNVVSWIDNTGNLWVFGGNYAYEPYNEFWKYQSEMFIWTQVSRFDKTSILGHYGKKNSPSSINIPSARESSVSWIDKEGNLWLFGGHGYSNIPSEVAKHLGGDLGALNDLWKYDPAENTWTWVSGSNSIDASGIYGTKGVPSLTNIPKAREGAVSWTDKKGNFWLFGGSLTRGFIDGQWRVDYFNDLWKFNPANNTWTWVSGSRTANSTGKYGKKGVPAVNNAPGARVDAVSWTDETGNLWVFSGSGYADKKNVIDLNDLWKFNPTNNTWTWVSGSNTGEAKGIYGKKGVPAMANVPGARNSAMSWLDKNGNFWLFGGKGYDSSGRSGFLSDFWKYDPIKNKWVWVAGDDEIAFSDLIQKCIRIDATTWTDKNGDLLLFGGRCFGSLNNPERTSDNFLNDVIRIKISENKIESIKEEKEIPLEENLGDGCDAS